MTALFVAITPLSNPIHSKASPSDTRSYCNLVTEMEDQLKTWGRAEAARPIKRYRKGESPFCFRVRADDPSTGAHRLLWRAVRWHIWCGGAPLHYACHIEPNQKVMKVNQIFTGAQITGTHSLTPTLPHRRQRDKASKPCRAFSLATRSLAWKTWNTEQWVLCVLRFL